MATVNTINIKMLSMIIKTEIDWLSPFGYLKMHSETKSHPLWVAFLIGQLINQSLPSAIVAAVVVSYQLGAEGLATGDKITEERRVGAKARQADLGFVAIH